MIILVTGGSGSGKSSLAEEAVRNLGEHRRFYIATMQCFDEETRQRILRHRRMRRDKHFETIEQPVNLGQCVLPVPGVALLECISNLVANEMYSPNGYGKDHDPNQIPAYILEGIRHLAGQCKHLVIVSNEVASDGIGYDTSTMEYIRVMGIINAGLARMADEAYEVVYGIPIPLKSIR